MNGENLLYKLKNAFSVGTHVIRKDREPYIFKMPDGHGGAHQPDECISIDGMLEALELTMLMLLECDKEDIKCSYCLREI